jgi:hypothetical protein
MQFIVSSLTFQNIQILIGHSLNDADAIDVDDDCRSCQPRSIACVGGYHSTKELGNTHAAWLWYQTDEIIATRKHLFRCVDPIGK